MTGIKKKLVLTFEMYHIDGLDALIMVYDEHDNIGNVVASGVGLNRTEAIDFLFDGPNNLRNALMKEWEKEG